MADVHVICADMKEFITIYFNSWPKKWIKFWSCMAPVYTPLCSQEWQLEQWGGLFSLILPHHPDLPPSDFHLFVPLKDVLLFAVSWTMMTCNTACVKNSDASGNRFMLPAYSISRSSWICVLMMMKILWKNNLHAVEDLHMKYVNFITIENIVSKKKIGITFVLMLAHYENQPELWVDDGLYPAP